MNHTKFIVGKTYIIKKFRKGCDVDYKRRLLTMGFVLGAKFKVIRVAPLGDPIQIQIKDFCLSLRKVEAQVMILEMVD